VSTKRFIAAQADQIEQMADTGAIFALTISDITAEQRAFMLHHHQRVQDELRQRGHQVRANVVRDVLGEHLTVVIHSGARWAMPDEPIGIDP